MGGSHKKLCCFGLTVQQATENMPKIDKGIIFVDWFFHQNEIA